MGCIETPTNAGLLLCPTRLIVIWDVLKLLPATAPVTIERINSNMGCIETELRTVYRSRCKKINSNMGCIETSVIPRRYFHELD